MSKESKKLFSYLLTLVMVISMVCTGSMTAQAAVLTNDGTEITQTSQPVTVSTNEDGQTVYTLTGDVTDGLSLTLSDDETAVLDGQGHSISGKAADEYYDNDTGWHTVRATPALSVSGTGTLIIENASFQGGDDKPISATSPSGIVVSGDVNVILKESVTITGGSAASGRSEADDGFDGSYGMDFSGKSLVIAGSNVLLKGSDGGKGNPAQDGPEYDGSDGAGGAGLKFNGQLYTVETGAGVTLTGGSGSTAGKGMDYVSGLVHESVAAYLEGTSTYKVTLCYPSGTSIYYIKQGSTVDKDILPYPTVEGSRFEGWYTDQGYATPADSTLTISNDTSLYAKYKSNSTKYTVTFDTKGGSTVASQTNIAYNGKATRPEDPTKEGCDFAGWYTDSNCTTAYSFATPVTDNITLYAKWGCTVTFDANGGSNVNPVIVGFGEKVNKPTAPRRTGYTFGGWYTDKECTTGREFDFENTSVNSNITLYAKWTINTYTVTFNTYGGSNILLFSTLNDTSFFTLNGAVSA